MSSNRLHCIYDPLCGWCYGAAPLVAEARNFLEVVLHGGGMMTGPNRQKVTDNLRNYVSPHDRRISQLTGQVFGKDYFDGLLRDTTAVFDSAPPIAAILTAQELNQQGLDMLARVQRAHYVEGKRVADADVLQALAGELGMNEAKFGVLYAKTQGAQVEAHIAQSRGLLQRVSGSGFPTLVLEKDGALTKLDTGAYLGKLEHWRAALEQRVTA